MPQPAQRVARPQDDESAVDVAHGERVAQDDAQQQGRGRPERLNLRVPPGLEPQRVPQRPCPGDQRGAEQRDEREDGRDRRAARLPSPSPCPAVRDERRQEHEGIHLAGRAGRQRDRRQRRSVALPGQNGDRHKRGGGEVEPIRREGAEQDEGQGIQSQRARDRQPRRARASMEREQDDEIERRRLDEEGRAVGKLARGEQARRDHEGQEARRVLEEEVAVRHATGQGASAVLVGKVDEPAQAAVVGRGGEDDEKEREVERRDAREQQQIRSEERPCAEG